MSDSREAAWGTGFRQPGGLLYLWASDDVNQVIYSQLSFFFFFFFMIWNIKQTNW